MTGRIAVAASFADIDNDGDEDLFVTTVRGGNLLFENDGRGRFHDVTAESSRRSRPPLLGQCVFRLQQRRAARSAGLQCRPLHQRHQGRARGIRRPARRVFRPHVPGAIEHPVLYQNLGQPPLQRCHDRGEAAARGMVRRCRSRRPQPGRLARRLLSQHDGRQPLFRKPAGGRTFVEKTKSYFPKTSWGAMGIKFFDYDNDGRLDLFVTDMHSDMCEDVGPELGNQKGQASG